jgi:glutamate-ammonia-ligase adenylyltransferase
MNLISDLFNHVSSHVPGVDPAIVQAFLVRVEADYLATFDPKIIAGHLVALMKLSDENPVQILLHPRERGLIECVVLAFDHPFEFSSISGLMAGTGFSIESSDAFTLPRVKSSRPPRRRQDLPLRRRDPMKDPVILDYFRGNLLGPVEDFESWAKLFTPAIIETIHLLDQPQEESTNRAKRLVNERVTQWLKARHQASAPSTRLVSLDVTVQQLPRSTRLLMRAPDTPAFLYALSTALSLHGLQIVKTRARTLEGNAVNEIDIVDRNDQPLVDPQALEQLQRSVLLTLQFAYFLQDSPDPFTALQRFDELSRQIVQIPEAGQWLEVLANPLTMTDLAKVLGASHFLWEDFIRFKADALLPVFQRRVRGQELCPPARSLPLRLEQALAGVTDFEQQRIQLNQFKDRELFLIDLDHILAEDNPDSAFQLLSERLVFLAENLVAAACRLVQAELVRLYGRPRNAGRSACGLAVFGLGKLGGVALGYASDIELLYVYEIDGTTSGGTRGSLDNGEFFAILARETRNSILAKSEGIFQVDLRLRPFGDSGPLAISKRQFAAYYGSDADAHEFERLALVRLRWIAGDPKLGFAVEQMRDELLYEGKPLDGRSVWQISGKMRLQHAKSGKFNSKHSRGALADLEQTVQLLQVMHAGQAPQLRTPRLQEAMHGLRRAGVFSAQEFDQLMAAYQFMRRLINAQRMLRGSARDLFLPAEDSDELIHLARRMRYAPEDGGDPGAMLLRDFQRHTLAVRRFIKRRFNQRA